MRIARDMASHCQPFEEKKNIKQTNDGLSPAIFGSRRLLTHPEKQSTSPPPEKMGERRYTEQEEALEIKSLRRIIAAYAKYAHPSRLLFYPGELAPIHSYGVTAAAVDWKCINGGTRC